MTKCLSCGNSHHDLELNCPKCGSFYSNIAHEVSNDDLQRKQSVRVLLTEIKVHLAHPTYRVIAIGTVIFLVIAVMFL